MNSAGTTLILVRHGETAWNAEGRFRGHQDIALARRGRRQAQALGRALAPLMAGGRIYSSPLRRCLATARPLSRASGVEVELEPALIDRDFGLWSGMSYDEVARRFPSAYQSWLTGDPESSIPGGESLQQVAARLERFLGALVARPHLGPIILVTHEAVCQVAVCLLLGLPLDRCCLIRQDNGHADIFRLGTKGVAVEGINVPPAAARALLE
jgi:broad specificity phosphatase PhoE